MLDDECELSADQVIDSRARNADKIMQAKSENVYAYAALAGARSQQARGNSPRHAPSIRDVSEDHVEKSRRDATHQNCRQRTGD